MCSLKGKLKLRLMFLVLVSALLLPFCGGDEPVEVQEPEMKVRIEKLEPMVWAYASAFGKTPEKEAWEKLLSGAKANNLAAEGKKAAFFGFNSTMPKDQEGAYGYNACIAVERGAKVEGLKLMGMPAGLYAVTQCKGVQNLPKIWEKLTEWSKTSKYKAVIAPGLALCLERHMTTMPGMSPGSEVIDVYLPISEKLQPLEVRTVKLEPMVWAYSTAFGASPEEEAWKTLMTKAKAGNLPGRDQGTRFFGFNSSEPKNEKGEYGYNAAVTVAADMKVEGTEMMKRPGLLYAVARCYGVRNLPKAWNELVEWSKTSKYKAVTDPALTLCLEEHIGIAPGLNPDTEPIDIYLPVTGEEEFSVRIVDSKPILLAYTTTIGKSPEAESWNTLQARADAGNLIADRASHLFFGFDSAGPKNESGEYGYNAGVVVEKETKAEGVKYLKIPAGLYAVAKVTGIENIGPGWKKLREWVDKSEYTADKIPARDFCLEARVAIQPAACNEAGVLSLYFPITK